MDPRLQGGVGSYNTEKIKKLAAKQLKKYGIKLNTSKEATE